MKNLTVSLKDSSYGRARVKAAQMGRSLSSIVSEFLEKFAAEKSEFERLHEMELELRKEMDARGGGLRASERLTREEIYDERFRR